MNFEPSLIRSTELQFSIVTELFVTTVEYQGVLQNYHRNFNQKNQPILLTLVLFDSTLSVTHRSIWSFKNKWKMVDGNRTFDVE